jgi:hypothetical protein
MQGFAPPPPGVEVGSRVERGAGDAELLRVLQRLQALRARTVEAGRSKGRSPPRDQAVKVLASTPAGGGGRRKSGGSRMNPALSKCGRVGVVAGSTRHLTIDKDSLSIVSRPSA